MTVDVKALVAAGWYWRPYTVGGVLTVGPLEVWLPDGRVNIHGKFVADITTTEECEALRKALKL